MKSRLRSLSALLLALAMAVSVLSTGAFAATSGNVKSYKNYLALGDSIGSGFGQPAYNQYNRMVVWGQRIPGSYADLVAKATKSNLQMLCMPGYTTACLRYELDDNFTLHDWEIQELSNFTYGAYDQAFLDQMRGTFRNAIRKADLISLDIGINDTWYSTIALIYYIAESANNENLKYGDTRGTLEYELQQYGSMGAVSRNALAYLDGFATNPTQWARFWALWVQNLSGYLTAFKENYDAIVKGIYRYNPNATIVAVGGYNPYKDWKILPIDGLHAKLVISDNVTNVNIPVLGEVDIPGTFNLRTGIAAVPQTMYDLFNATRESYTAKYPGQYYYADVPDTEMIGGLSVSLYEFSSLDDSGFNPHPTAAGHQYMADQIIGALPSRNR